MKKYVKFPKLERKTNIEKTSRTQFSHDDMKEVFETVNKTATHCFEKNVEAIQETTEMKQNK